MMATAPDMARLRWACRRGMLELDILFGNFLSHSYPQLSLAQQEQFVALLECNDQQLFDWLIKRLPVTDSNFQPIVHLLLQHATPTL